jgi:hypothetical protein
VRSSRFGLLLVLVLSGAALAARPAKPPPPPPANPPQVTFTLDAASADAGWQLHVENTGTLPLRFVADTRLLTLEISGADGGAAIKCSLPADARPATDTERVLVLPPGRSWSERFDPRLFCFGTRDEKALAPGAMVTAHLGWSPASATTVPPFVLSPPDLDPKSTGDAGAWPTPVKEIVSAPLSLPAAAPKAGAESSAVEGPRLSVRMTANIDGGTLFDQTVTVTVRNDGIRSESVFVQPVTVGFDLSGPAGTRRCSLGVSPVAVRDLVTTLGAGGSTSVSVALDRICGPGSFDRAGVYRVAPVLDTRRVAPPMGLKLATGQWTGEPSLVRVRSGKIPAPAPQLDPIAKK